MRGKRAHAMTVVVAACLALAGCGADASGVPPLHRSGHSSRSATASDAASLTPAQAKAAAVRAVREYARLTERFNRSGDAAVLYPVVTRGLAGTLARRYHRLVLSRGQHFIGQSRIASAAATLSGGSARVRACADTTRLFLVPKGTTSVQAGSSVHGGARKQVEFGLAQEGSSWKITRIDAVGAPC